MKSKEEIQIGINEMWDAIAHIPNNDPAKGLAWDQAAEAERKAWEAYNAEQQAPQLPAAARRHLIDIIEATYPIDSQYADTRSVGDRILHEAIWHWAVTQLPKDWREMPAEILEEYAQACARMECRGYPEAEDDYAKWWDGYKEAKQQHSHE